MTERRRENPDGLVEGFGKLDKEMRATRDLGKGNRSANRSVAHQKGK
ncbi:hypothetical protein [Mesorhizobium sp. ES1-4]|nr:hypothetical protein [Mesorhizobium sp. ES1-4]MBZ9799469.1 hypothetical protein [Mesorhizobium sp. ES1-4]